MEYFKKYCLLIIPLSMKLSLGYCFLPVPSSIHSPKKN